MCAADVATDLPPFMFKTIGSQNSSTTAGSCGAAREVPLLLVPAQSDTIEQPLVAP